MTLKRKLPSPLHLHLSVILSVFGLSVIPVWGETVLIESRTCGGTTVGCITPNPPYAESPAASWSGSTAHTGAAGTTSGLGCRYAFTGTPVLTLTPTLIAGAMYAVEISHVLANASPNLVVNVSYSGCTGTASSTTVFDNTVSSPNWERVGTITVNAGVTNPSVIFTYASGTLAGSGGRWYSDAFRFINLSDPCVSSLPQLTTVNGPLFAGQTYVDVPAVTNVATAVTVYANGVQIGQKTTGISNGVNRVTTSPLVKGQVITVTQSNDAEVESCRPGTGPLVGGGANPRIRISVSIRQATNSTMLTGPIGANGGILTLPLKFLGATNTIGGSGNAPSGGKVFYPSNEWQTVSFLRGPNPASPVDPTFAWANSDGTSQLKYDFGVLESVGLAIDDLTDTGPFDIYIDDFKNGDVLIQNFEAAANGANTVLFNQPSASGSTDPFLLSQPPGTYSPDISKVSNATADTGTNSLHVNWQFKDTAPPNWVRLIAQGSDTPNPQLDLRLPISFRMLLLPVGSTVTSLPPVIVSDLQDQVIFQGSSPTLTVSVHGSQPFGYQWRFNGNPLPNATNSSLTLTNVQPSDAGNYSVDVSNSINTAHSRTAAVTVAATTLSSAMTPLWHLATGSRYYLANDNSLGGIAYNPITGNLLLVSRAGSNSVQVLDGTTGAFIRTLKTDPGIITGGALALNLIGVSDDGAVFAANLTTNLTTPQLKLYVWPDDSGSQAPQVAWQGDPAGGAGADSWGTSMAVRGAGDSREIWFGSGSGTLVSFVVPAFGSDGNVNPAAALNVDGASPGDFSRGIAFGEGTTTIWGKTIGGLCRHANVDLFSVTITVTDSYEGYPNMGPIAVDPAHKLLAGISIEGPDNLRLCDLSNLGGAGMWNLDTEFFPTDNPNPSHSGAVAFGPNRVYAVDSNNGIIAMSLNLGCVPIKLTATRSGQNIVLSWGRPDYRLQGATTLGSWNNISGGSPSTNLISGTQFFRLVCP